jgi:hypothetical protein
MLMGFIGIGNSPPAPASSDDDPSRDRTPDDTGIRVTPSSRELAYGARRNTSVIGRYAWAISLGIHGIVLIGAFLAMRYYFRPPPAPKTSAQVESPDGVGTIVQSADASDLIHDGSGLTFVAGDSASDQQLLEGENQLPFVGFEPQTTKTLNDLTPISGVESIQRADASVLARLPFGSAARAPAATQPSRPH